MRGFYFITDKTLSRRGITSDTRDAVAAGAVAVQYRDKTSSTATLYAEALKLRSLCRGVPFIVNDRLDIALAVGADGVHLGQDDLPLEVARRLLGKKKIIGVTVHSVKEAVLAQARGANYLGVSPVFSTRTKMDAGVPAGIELVKAVSKTCRLPIVAIGGITLANAPRVIAAGADALCAISAVQKNGDVKNQIMRFRDLYR